MPYSYGIVMHKGGVPGDFDTSEIMAVAGPFSVASYAAVSKSADRKIDALRTKHRGTATVMYRDDDKWDTLFGPKHGQGHAAWDEYSGGNAMFGADARINNREESRTMSVRNRIKALREQNLDDKIIGNDEEGAALSTGADGGFYDRTQSAQPKAVMVTPASATWEYNPVDVRGDDDYGEVGGERVSDDDQSPSDGEYELSMEARATVDTALEDIKSIAHQLLNG